MIRSGSMLEAVACANRPASVVRWASEKLVTTRNGDAARLEAPQRLDRARERLALEDEDAVGVEDEALDPVQGRAEVGRGGRSGRA